MKINFNRPFKKVSLWLKYLKHNRDIKCKKFNLSAKKAGFDAVKLQTYKPDTITLKSNKKDFLLPKNSPWVKKIYGICIKTHHPGIGTKFYLSMQRN